MDNSRWTPDRDHVERLAYQYWEERGCEHGCHETDWLRAEDEIRRLRREPIGRAERTVIGVFESLAAAQNAYDKLKAEGIPADEISFIANRADAERAGQADESASAELAVDAGIGAAMGGVGGLLLGFAGLAVPGVGPVLAAGPIIAAIGGAGVGAAAGGLIGALTEGGVPEEDAAMYSEGIRRGNILIAVHASNGVDADKTSKILDQSGAVSIDDRVSSWRKRGWTGYDASAQPMTAEELRREREYYRSAEKQGKEWSKRTSKKAPAPAPVASRLSRIYSR